MSLPLSVWPAKDSCLAADTVLADWLLLIKSEFLEIPDLCLTKAQVERLWGLDAAASEVLLRELVDARFLRRTRAGAYVRVE
jgi:hypothetical protein